MNYNKKNIYSAIIFSILAVIAYLITSNNKLLLFLVFAGERLYHFGAKESLEIGLDEELKLEDTKSKEDLEKNTDDVDDLESRVKAINGFAPITVLFFINLGLSIYAVFKHPFLLLVFIAGEILDFIIYNSYIALKRLKGERD